MLFDPFQQYKNKHLTFDFARKSWELNNYYQLRKNIFCDEQKIFKNSDIDLIDKKALHIISTSEYMAMTDQVIGTVRIHETKPTVWLGSRLGVHTDYRKLKNYQSQQLFNDNIAVKPFTMSVGAGLIYKAVTTAKTLGCTKFQAHVQYQNKNFFEQLFWKDLGTVMLHGYLHHLMEADLNFYPSSNFINRVNK